MTREQIEELRRYHDEATAAVSCAAHDDGEWCEFCTALSKMATFAANNAPALLAAAERALVLEDVLSAAKEYTDRLIEARDNEDDEMQWYLDDNEDCAWDKMCAAIDRAEGK